MSTQVLEEKRLENGRFDINQDYFLHMVGIYDKIFFVMKLTFHDQYMYI